MNIFLTPKKEPQKILKKQKLGQPVTRNGAQEFFKTAEMLATHIRKRDQKSVKTERIYLPWDKTKIAFKVRNVLTPEECQALIQASEKAGYERALVNIGGGRQILNIEYRDSYRVMIDHSEISKAIYDKVVGHNNEVLKALGNHLNGRIKPVEMNERLRFLKYHEKQKFSMHYDGSYTRPSSHPNKGDCSYFTILIYLNKDYNGSTRLFDGYDSDSNYYDVLPEEGMAFVHQHNILHAGMEIRRGRKYAIRSDIMCRHTDQNTF